MRQYFSTKVSYAKENEQGLLKKVTEEYILEGISFGDVEARVYGIFEQIIRGDFHIKSISRSNVVDIFFYDSSEYWHKCKIAYHVADEATGKEKKVVQVMLVNASTVEQAYARINESLDNMLVTFTVPEVIETKIEDVFLIEKED